MYRITILVGDGAVYKSVDPFDDCPDIIVVAMDNYELPHV
jgi:hypothetical protein